MDKNFSNHYASIFEHAKVGIVFVDHEGSFIDVNNKFCEIAGYSKEELLTLKFADITHKEDINEDLELHQKTIKEGASTFSLEKRYIRKDGSIVWVEIFINHITDKNGNYLHSLTFVNDITKRKKIQDTIFEQTKTMQLYLDVVDVMIVAINNQGNITLVNRKTCEILGYDEYQLVGKNWFKNFVSQNDRDNAIESYLSVLNKEKDIVDKVQYKIICKDGKERIILWRRAYIFDDRRNILGVISSGEDVTDILKLEAENRKSEQALFNQSKLASMGEMLRNIAHQWRQPLSTISTAASGARLQKELGVLSDEEFNNSMNAIVDTSKYLSQTIDDFQNYFKADNSVKEFSSKDLLERVKNLIATNYKSNDIELVLKSSESFLIRSNFNEIMQIILNLLNNAKDAFCERELSNRIVIIEEKFVNNALELMIKDNAGGVNPSIMNRIFEPYFTTKHQSVGTGIGLYMAKDILENRLDGFIEVYNEELEHNEEKRDGAVFKLTIPNLV